MVAIGSLIVEIASDKTKFHYAIQLATSSQTC